MSTYRRKRDGALYTTNLQVTTFPNWGACVQLVPVWHGRTHWKTVKAFNKQFEAEPSHG
ncbi:hypothetical protein NG726_11815 [Pseudomonas sp. MOB-449]|nr:hypothetical protein [Pseudomonas sp. MOB-449]